MSDFEAAGRQHVISEIEALEDAPPGLFPMFYRTLSFEGDIAAADALRQKFGLPRPPERQAEIDAKRKAHEAALEQAALERKKPKRPWWAFWAST